VDVTFTQTTSTVSDSDLHSMALAMLNSNAIQSLNWVGTPTISGITRDTTETIFPA